MSRRQYNRSPRRRNALELDLEFEALEVHFKWAVDELTTSTHPGGLLLLLCSNDRT